ncbi:hypothetical protein C3747_7g470 [Trypanosoma cruzi]|uniref:Uncharacterized protein n=2 Tax=Trypanosoma cruzi TaxID=5693 RepID=Q4D0P6_TRYCC|nr:hypothetical protein, conserved [Trypanosoma cruzi]EAN86101.1 hypothetical protein, conserved [Trypanosoma cruzi]PWV20105.1 hypothetical protein C3747_7g470 [Trypanosoma cruzi]RNC43133.1 hypothetical protein TcCL_NonESM07174 [Trypanosoma cruzi]|eukprot:XP_807952.1 hypothetical protein [Trypanosoma cruzi strain CL Brener]
MRPSSHRRPKSSAASDVGRRIRYSDAPPWDRSIRVNGDRALSAGRASRRGPEMMNTKLQGTPARPSHCNLATTQAATLVATVPPVNEPQVELMSQLQDVVVRLSQSAVGEKQRLAHMQQRLDAYAALMREQDRMIDELRGMNIRLQKERDALILFRQQSLNHDLHLMNNLENDGGIDEEARRAYAKYEGQKNSYGTPCNGSFGAMTPRSRGFVRSLVAQLRDERRKRLEVEEQSSRMIGEQQLTIQRLEDRLRPQVVAPRSVLVSRLESPQVSSHQRASNEEKDAVNTPLQCPCVDSVSAPMSSPTFSVVNQEKRLTEVNPMAPVVPPIPLPERNKEAVITEQVHQSPAVSMDQQITPPLEVPLKIHSTSYDDAAAILFDIRKRHGL